MTFSKFQYDARMPSVVCRSCITYPSTKHTQTTQLLTYLKLRKSRIWFRKKKVFFFIIQELRFQGKIKETMVTPS